MAQTNIKAVITAEDRASATLKSFGDNADNVGNKIATSLKVAGAALIAAGTAATGFAVKSAADFEQTRIGLENMLGSADKARAVLSQVSKFAAETPFEFPELAQSVRQLVAFGFNAEDAVNTMKQLGDVSAAVGAPINDLAYLMGTLKTQGRAFTIDIRQFAQRGIPIYEYLAKVLKTNEQEISKMIETGKIGFPEVQKAFAAMTGEGGKFHGTMAKQSKSLSGLFSTLKDNIGLTARELVGINQEGDIKAGSLFDRLRLSVAGLNNILPRLSQNFQNAITSILPQLQQWANTVSNVAIQIGDYLQPKLVALWNTIRESMPTFKQLYEEVLQPLAVAFGTTLVVALGLLVDAINVMMAVLTPAIQWMLENKATVVALATAFGILALAMNFNAIVAGFNGAMTGAIATINILRLTTIPNALLALSQFAGGFGPVALAATVAAGVIIDAGNKAKQAWDNTSKAIQSASSSNDAVLKNLQNISKNGTPEQQQRAKATLKGLAEGGAFASGGFTGVGGTNEVAGVVHKGEYVIPKSQVDQSTGTPRIGSNQTINITIQAGAFMGSQQDARKYASLIMGAWRDVQSSNGVMA